MINSMLKAYSIIHIFFQPIEPENRHRISTGTGIVKIFFKKILWHHIENCVLTGLWIILKA